MDKQRAVIKIASAEDKDRTVKIYTDDKKIWFNLWKTKPDGSPSPSFLTFQSLGFAPTVEIEYVEKDKSFVGKEGNTVEYKERTIWSLKPANGETPTPIENSRPGASQSATGHSKEAAGGRNFEQEAYEKCCSIWSAALLQRTDLDKKTIMDTLTSGQWWELFQAIKADGEKKFSSAPAPAPAPATPAQPWNQWKQPVAPSDDDKFVPEIPF